MIVSNTTPISNFLLLNRIDILKQLFKEIHISQTVKYEIEDFFSTHEDWQQSLHEGFIVVHQVQHHFMLKQFLNVLHPGEAETLCLCMEHNAQLCLVDDKNARAFAEFNNIKISGTLGILIAAKKKGVIEVVKPFMDMLRTKHRFWISDNMYEKVLQTSHEE